MKAALSEVNSKHALTPSLSTQIVSSRWTTIALMMGLKLDGKSE